MKDHAMKRRSFVTLLASAALAAPLPARAQSARKPVVGVLFLANPEPALGVMRNALRSLGYIEGETILLDVRVAASSQALLADMAADLVARKVDVIVAVQTSAVVAAKKATASIPIVMPAAGDPVGMGLVASLARPGGNITGYSSATAEMAGKSLELLREAVPKSALIGVLVDTTDPFYVRFIEQIELANSIVKIELRIFKVARPDEIAGAFDAMAAAGIDAAIVQPSLPRTAVIAQAVKHRLPTASPTRDFAVEGGLMSYAGNFAIQHIGAMAYVDKILKGAKPADLPVEQPTRFELVINAKTAKALGLEIPVLLLARADEVIE